MIKGRQFLRLTYEQYALASTRGSFYDNNVLMDTKYHRDTNIKQLPPQWKETVEGLKAAAARRAGGHPFSRYRMARQGSSKRCYKYVHGAPAR